MPQNDNIRPDEDENSLSGNIEDTTDFPSESEDDETIGSEIADEPTGDHSSLYEEEEENYEEGPSAPEKIKNGIKSVFDRVVKILMVPEDSDSLLEDDDEDEIGDIFSKKFSFLERKTDKNKDSREASETVRNVSEPVQDVTDAAQDDPSSVTDEESKNDVPEIKTGKADSSEKTEDEGVPASKTGKVKENVTLPVSEIPKEKTRAEKPHKKRTAPIPKEKPANRPGVLASASLYTMPENESVHKKEKPKKTEKEETPPLLNTPVEHIASEAAESSPAEKKTAVKPSARDPHRSEITLDDIMKAKNSAEKGNVKVYGKTIVQETPPVNKETEVPIFVKKNKSVHGRANAGKDRKNDRKISNDSFDFSALSYGEGSESGTKTSAPVKNPRAQELSHELPKPSEPVKQPRVQELSHEPPKPSEPVKQPRAQELSHEPPKPSEPVKQPRAQELSHEPPKPSEPVKQPRVQELSHEPPKPSEPVKQPRAQELSHEPPKPVESVTKETADEIPGGEGVKIEPWEPVKKHERKDFAEGRSDHVIYRSPEADPFVVMAGKFTKTLKTEYESTRRIRGEITEEKEESHQTEKVHNVPPPQSVRKHTVNKESPRTIEDISAARGQARKKSESPAEKKSVRTKKEKPIEEEAAKKEKMPVKSSKPAKSAKPAGKNKQQKKKFHFTDIFDYEGDRFDEEEEEEEVKSEISDYTKAEDAKEIRGDIGENFRKVFVRTIVLSCTCIASIVTAIVAKAMPWVFLNMLKNGWLVYSAIMFLLFLVSVYLSRYPIFNGFAPLKKLKGNSDTPISVASLAVAVQSIVSLFQPDVFLNETYHIYVPLLILALLLNSMGKLLIIRRTADNFRFLRSDSAKYAGKIYTNTDNAERFVSGLPSRRPIIAYSKYSKFMSNFLQLSYASDPVEELSAMFAPIGALLSLVSAVVYGIVTADFVGGVSFFAMAACITLPMCSLLAINIPMLNLCASANRNGAMIVGYEAVKQFCDTNTIMLESSDLYPKGNIVLSGMKTINESKLREAISAGASMTFAVNGPLTHVFETIVRQSKFDLPEYESVSYDDEMGLSGWCNGSRILIGRRELFKKHNIRLPDESIETRYRKRGNEIVYISVGGELAVMFILTYKVDKAIAQSLRDLEDSGVNFVVRTIDPNVTQKHIAEKFNLYPRCIKVLPTGIGQICHDELTAKEKTSRAYLVTNGKLSSFANAVAGCIRIKSTVTIAKIVQYLAIIVGFILVTVIAFISGFAKLGSVELLLWTGFWCAAMIIVSIAARRLS